MRLSLLLLGVVASVLALWFLLRDEGELASVPSPGAVGGASVEEGTVIDGERLEGGRETVTDRFVAPERFDEEAASETDPTEETVEIVDGVVRGRIIDAVTGEDLSAVRLRAIDGERVDEITVDSPFRWSLPAGTRSLVAIRAGYERTRLEIIFPEAKTAELEPIAMDRGRGAIDGRLVIPAATLKVARVELHAHAAQPKAAVPSQDSFRFDALTSGVYLVVVRDGRDGILATRRVALDPGATEFVTIRVELVDLTIHVEDAEGRPFDGLWQEKGAWFSSRLRLFFWADELCSAVAIIPAADRGIAVNRDPAAEADATSQAVRPSPFRVNLGSGGESEAAAEERDRKELEERERRAARRRARPVARARQKGEDVWPAHPSPAPDLVTRPLNATRIAPGTYSVRGVPVDVRRTLAACGPSMSEHVPLDLTRASSGPIVLRIKRKCGASMMTLMRLADENTAVRCTSCHGLPTSTFR